MIGNGNVAIDVARMLVLDPDELAVTDTADHALDALAAASVHEVIVLGRRGPAQAAFTTPELRELGELTRADIVVDPAAELDDYSATGRRPRATRPPSATSSCCATTRSASRTATTTASSCASSLPGRDPRRRRGRSRTGVRVVKNRIENGRAVPTGEEEVIACGLVLRSIGYRGAPLPGVPFDERRGLIPNDGGRVPGRERRAAAGEYAVGWIKRGPSGVIGTNKKDATDTVARSSRTARPASSTRPRTPIATPASSSWPSSARTS